MKCNICNKEFDNVNNAYEPYICDECFDKHFGYCDNCGKVFAYHKHMFNSGFGVYCGECVCRVKKDEWKG